MVAMFVNGSNGMNNSYRGSSIDASYHVSVNLAKLFQSRRFLRNRAIRNKNCLWRPCLLMDRDKMSIPSFGSFGQAVSEKIFRNRPIRNKNGLWWPCVLADRDEISNLYRGPSIDASYQISAHFGKAVSEKKIFRNQPI